MRKLSFLFAVFVFTFASAHAGDITQQDWARVVRAFRHLDGLGVAGLVEGKSGLLVRSASTPDDKGVRLYRKHIIFYFQQLKKSKRDARTAGPLGFTSILPSRMPKPDAMGRYVFDRGHGQDDKSYLRFTVVKGKVWLSEVTAWGEMEALP